MNKFNRDLLVLFKEETNPQAIQNEVDQLHELLYCIETVAHLALAHEVININKRRISSRFSELFNVLNCPELKPFVFLNNKN